MSTRKPPHTPDLFESIQTDELASANPNPAQLAQNNLGNIDCIDSNQDTDKESIPVVAIHTAAARDYLEYAIAVVKGRALPDIKDGLKPVQRRVLFAMRELGLSATAKPVKSARVVGDVIGKYHPHGDTSAYDAMVRVAQDFSLRYPLVDGQGNFGSRDGDNAAAMRYTEARLTPIAELLLGELGEGTVDFQANYDGAFNEPAYLPARLPFALLNGASGIAVGMATEIPSHNLREVAAAAIHLLQKGESAANDEASLDAIMAHLPGPDYPGGAHIISPARDIANAYRSGRGSLRVRARYHFEERAKGAWQLVFDELPPGVSSAKVLAEIGALLNPQAKAGKKTIEQNAAQLKALFAAQLERARDESGKDDAIRLVFEPLAIRQDRADFVALLLAHTSLETSVPINLVAIGLDGRPCQKTLPDLLKEWCQFRVSTVRKRSEWRLAKAQERIHILEGRHIVFLNIDEVIRIIRETEDAKNALCARFALSEKQSEDILDIRLRQLARLEGIKIEQELAKLRDEQDKLNSLLGDEQALRKQVIGEIKSDAKQYGDARRTLIAPAEIASRNDSQRIHDEAVTLIVSQKNWARVRQGHGLDLSTLNFKDGDQLGWHAECRSIDPLVILSKDGRAYTIPVASLPDGRGMGAPLSAFAELEQNKIAHLLTGQADEEWLIAKSSGYGFICRFADLMSRQKAGKSFLTVEAKADILPPIRLPAEAQRSGQEHIAALSADGRLLLFPLTQMKRLSAGKGVQIIGLREPESLRSLLVANNGKVIVNGLFRGKAKQCRSEAHHQSQRARRGAPAGLINATGLTHVED